MICQLCSSHSAFMYSGLILCAGCATSVGDVKPVEYKKSEICTDNLASNDECEICGEESTTSYGLSALCNKCSTVVENCQHVELEKSENVVNYYLVTTCLCLECGVRFRK